MQRSDYIQHAGVDSMLTSPLSTYRRRGYPDGGVPTHPHQLTPADRQCLEDELLHESDNKAAKLHALCLHGTVQDIKNFFNTNKDLNENETDNSDSYYYDGQTPLHTTVLLERDDVEQVIDVLIENGIDVNAEVSADGSTALHLVVEQGNFPADFNIVHKLLEHNADVTIRNRSLRTPYDCALGMGYDSLAVTLEGMMSPKEAKEYYGKHTQLLYAPYLTQAVLESDAAGIRKNLKHGADPNVLNSYGAGAIHYAITHCNLPVLQTLQSLRQGGADVNLRDDEGDTALNLAIKVDRLKEPGLRAKVVSKLLEWGADQSYRDLDGKDALQLATEKHYNDVVTLLTRGQPRRPSPVAEPEPEPEPVPVPQPIIEDQYSEPEPEVEDNDLPPDLNVDIVTDPPPVESEVPDVSTQPTENQPDIEDNDDNNEPEQDCTDSDDDVEVDDEDDDDSQTEEEDVFTPDEKGLYPLHRAVFIHDPVQRRDAIAAILRKGANVNAVVKATGNTALHLASEQNKPGSVEQLLDADINHTKKNRFGRTAYEIAKRNSYPEVKRLLEAKANRAKRNEKKNRKDYCKTT